VRSTPISVLLPYARGVKRKKAFYYGEKYYFLSMLTVTQKNTDVAVMADTAYT
jgi:hypothetical protein